MPSRGGGEPCEQTSRGAAGRTGRSTRRRFLGTAAASGTVALSGCVSGVMDSVGGIAGGTKGGSDAVSKISVAAVQGEGELFKRLIKDHVEDETNVEVDVSLFPFANLYEKINSVLETKGDAYDIIFLADVWLPQFAQHCEPIPQWVPGDYPTDAIIQSCVDDGTWPSPDGAVVPSAKGMEEKLRGQVVVGNTQLFAYNESHYEAVGATSPPKTWDDVLSAGKKIDEQVDGVDGYVIRGKRGNPITTNFFSIGASKAGNMFDTNWKFTWDEKSGVDALRFYVNKLKAISPEGVSSFNSDQVLNHLGNGTGAQGAAWPAAASLLLDPKKSQAANDITFTVIPKGQRRAPELGTWMTAINTHVSDAKKKAAGKVIRSFVSKQAQQKYVELGGVPFRHDTFEENMDAQPWFDALYKSLQTAVWRPQTPLWNQIDVSFGKLLNTALTGGMSAEQTMTKANDEFESMMREAGYYEN